MFYALRELGNVQEGQTVLIHSAAGGCGTFALGICKQLKVKVVATVGSDEKVLFVHSPRSSLWISVSFCKSCFEMQPLHCRPFFETLTPKCIGIYVITILFGRFFHPFGRFWENAYGISGIRIKLALHLYV